VKGNGFVFLGSDRGRYILEAVRKPVALHEAFDGHLRSFVRFNQQCFQGTFRLAGLKPEAKIAEVGTEIENAVEGFIRWQKILVLLLDENFGKRVVGIVKGQGSPKVSTDWQSHSDVREKIRLECMGEAGS